MCSCAQVYTASVQTHIRLLANIVTVHVYMSLLTLITRICTYLYTVDSDCKRPCVTAAGNWTCPYLLLHCSHQLQVAMRALSLPIAITGERAHFYIAGSVYMWPYPLFTLLIVITCGPVHCVASDGDYMWPHLLCPLPLLIVVVCGHAYCLTAGSNQECPYLLLHS